ncbi:MAG: hypothetical protein M1548_06460 [Actinobacteria bacterium]|nr:hypothetical protein [Actinomycetota bacterium]
MDMKDDKSILEQVAAVLVFGNLASYVFMMIGGTLVAKIFGLEAVPAWLGGILMYILPTFLAGFLAGFIVQKPAIHYGILANAFIISSLLLGGIQAYQSPGFEPKQYLFLLLVVIIPASAGSLIGGIVGRYMLARKS